jgi:hypothetical protein
LLYKVYKQTVLRTEAHIVIRLFLLFLLLFGSGLLSSTTSGSSTTSSGRSSRASGTNVHEESREVLTSESLSVEGEPDGLNLNVGSLDKGGKLVSLEVERSCIRNGILKKKKVTDATNCIRAHNNLQ